MSNWKKTLALNVALMALSSTLFSCSRKEHPATGHWLGSITDDSGRESWGTLLVEPDNAGSHTVALFYPGAGAIAHVLGGFAPGEEEALAEALSRAADAVEVWAEHGVDAAMNRFN